MSTRPHNPDDQKTHAAKVEVLKTVFARKEETAIQSTNTRFYAEVKPHYAHPSLRVWSDARLYLYPPPQPDRNNILGYLGSVWLHNPSSAFYAPQPLGSWGQVPLNQPHEPDHNTLNFVARVLHLAIAAALLKGYNAPVNNPHHVRLEELVYVDSPGIWQLWKTLTPEQLKEYSHLNILPRAHPQFQNPKPKFIWLAWGDLKQMPARRSLFETLVREAHKAAVDAGADLMFVARSTTSSTPDYPTCHWSAKHNRWSKTWSAKTTYAAQPAVHTWDPIATPPLHPEGLRTLSATQVQTVEKDLAAAISEALI